MNNNRKPMLTPAPANQPSLRYELADLDAVAEQIKRVLAPVAPSPEFRARLRDGLRMAAYHREMRELLIKPPTEKSWGLLVGAAALGSAAGLLAILIRARQSPSAAAQEIAHAPHR